MNDPPVRSDGLCAVCLKPRRKVKPQKGVPPQLYVDPFCSTRCAREWHGNPLPEKSIWSVHHRRKDEAA